MRRFSRASGALVAAALLALSALPAAADNYDAKDGNAAHQTFAAKLVGGILHPLHLFEGLFAGVPTPVNMTNSGALDTTCVAGCSATTDLRPASSTIAVVDSGTATTTGQSSVALVTGTPTAGSFQTQAINGYSSGAVTVTGVFVETLAIEASYDGAATYVPVSGLLRGTNITTASITGPAVVSLDVTGATHVRVRATAYTSGTATVKMAFSTAAGMTKVLNGVKVVDSAGAAVDMSAAGSGIGATGAAVPANASLVGCRVATTIPTSVADGQLAAPRCGVAGDLVTQPFAPRAQQGRSPLVTLSSTTETSLIAAGTTGVFNDITWVKLCNMNASTDADVDVRDATAGTVQDSWHVPAAKCVGFAYPMPLTQTTSASAWTVKEQAGVSSVTVIAAFVQKKG